MTTPEEIMNGETVVEQSTPTINVDDVKAKREELSILACLGSTKEYLGVQMAIGDVHRLSDRDVERYYRRYKMVSGKNLFDGLVEPPLHLLIRGVNYLIGDYGGIDYPDTLIKDLKNNQLIKQWLSDHLGSIIVYGGTLSVLALFVTIGFNHFRVKEPSPPATLYDMANTDEIGVDTVR